MTSHRLPPNRLRRRQDGVALLEALLAAVLLAIGLLGTIGLQARAQSALADAGIRAEATIAAERLLGVMTTDANHLSDYAVTAGATPGERLLPWYNAIRKNIPGAKVTVTVTAGAKEGAPSEVEISIGWQRKADAPSNKHAVRAYI